MVIRTYMRHLFAPRGGCRKTLSQLGPGESYKSPLTSAGNSPSWRESQKPMLSFGSAPSVTSQHYKQVTPGTYYWRQNCVPFLQPVQTHASVCRAKSATLLCAASSMSIQCSGRKEDRSHSAPNICKGTGQALMLARLMRLPPHVSVMGR